MREIVDILLRDFVKRLHILDLQIEFTNEAKVFIMERGFDPALGARPLKRAIQRYVENPLAQDILAGRYKAGDKVVMHREEDHLAAAA